MQASVNTDFKKEQQKAHPDLRTCTAPSLSNSSKLSSKIPRYVHFPPVSFVIDLQPATLVVSQCRLPDTNPLKFPGYLHDLVPGRCPKLFTFASEEFCALLLGTVVRAYSSAPVHSRCCHIFTHLSLIFSGLMY